MYIFNFLYLKCYKLFVKYVFCGVVSASKIRLFCFLSNIFMLINIVLERSSL
uniref:Uncharacterized protein n=1 Tax=Anguilla anguilla TaxID=7936 RepID=A0A0E9V065_ANGAN